MTRSALLTPPTAEGRGAPTGGETGATAAVGPTRRRPGGLRGAPAAEAVSLALPGFAVALVVWPWLRPDVNWDRLADAPNHLVRVYVIAAALGRGEWFPRWLADLYLGYGYPLLNFYAPATYYVAAGLHRLGMTVYASLQWTGALAVALGTTGAYALARAVYARRDSALVVSAVFALAPYPFLTNLYVRAAIPEALALGLLPWLLLAAWGAWRRGGWRAPALAGLVAAMLLTHNVSSLLAFGLLAGWLGALAGLCPAPTRRAGARLGAAVALGAALGAFFWLPALAESRYVQIDLAQGGLYDFRNWVFDPARVTPPVARPDYPHTRLGPADLALVFDYSALGKAAPERISLGQVLLWLVAAGAGLAGWRRGAQAQRLGSRLGLCWAGMAVGCWFFGTTWSIPLWDHAPLLSLVQFPWRFYGPLALCLALAAGGAPAALPRAGWQRWAGRGVAAALLGLLAYGALAGRPNTGGREPAHDVDVRNVASLEKNRYAGGTTSGGEFLPRTVSWEYDAGGARRGIKFYEDAYPQAGWQAGLVRVLEGRAAVAAVYGRPHWIMGEVEAETPARIGFHQLLFPGWRAYVDGQEVSAGAARVSQPAEASLGFMVVDVPVGRHRVEVRFGPTPPRLAGSALSAGALALWIAWLGRRFWIGPARPQSKIENRKSKILWAAVGLVAVCAAAGAAGCAAAEARPPARVPAGAARVVLDVAGVVARAGAETQSPAAAGRGPLAPHVEVRYLRIADEERRWLFMHPPSEVAVRLRVPPNAYFQAGLALDPQTWRQDAGDGVRFVVEAEGAFGRKTLLDRHVHPRARGEERGWVDVWVDLEPVAGQEVRLVLRTDPAQDPSFDWAGWANPQVVIWDAARPHPGTVHQW